MTQIEAMALSAAIEGPVAYALVRLLGWPCRGPAHVAAAVMVATAASHPLLWEGALWLYGRIGYGPGLLLAESLVVAGEAAVAAWAARLAPAHALTVSVIANGASVLVGLLLLD